MVDISGALTLGRALRQAFPGVISFGRNLAVVPVNIPLYREGTRGTEMLRKCSKVTHWTLTRALEP